MRISTARHFLIATALVCAFSLTAGAAEKRHGLSAFGDLKYPADFKHFDYVNPDAPKGGRLVTIGTSHYDSSTMRLPAQLSLLNVLCWRPSRPAAQRRSAPLAS